MMFGDVPPRVKQLKSRGDVKGLVEGLDYHDRLVDKSGRVIDLAVPTRLEVVAALASLATAVAVRGLAAAIADESRQVRMAALSALGESVGDYALDAIAAAVANWPDEEDRRAAAELLATSRDDDASRRLATALARAPGRALESSDHDIVLRLASGAGQRRDRAVASLTEIMVNGDSRERERALQILIWHASDSVDPLIAVLDRTAVDSLDARRCAVLALGAIRDTRAVTQLCGVVRDDPHPAVRSLAASALGQLRDPLSAETLMAASFDEDFEVRTNAAQALDAIGSAGTIVGLISMIGPLLSARDQSLQPQHQVKPQPQVKSQPPLELRARPEPEPSPRVDAGSVRGKRLQRNGGDRDVDAAPSTARSPGQQDPGQGDSRE